MWDEGTTRGKMINGFLRGIRCLCFMINKFPMCHRKGHFQVLVFFPLSFSPYDTLSP